jgi:hypothetical protein
MSRGSLQRALLGLAVRRVVLLSRVLFWSGGMPGLSVRFRMAASMGCARAGIRVGRRRMR